VYVDPIRCADHAASTACRDETGHEFEHGLARLILDDGFLVGLVGEVVR
jgi:hypothetical protein